MSMVATVSCHFSRTVIVKPTIVAITAALPRISKIRTRNDRFTLDGGVGVAAGAGDGDWGDGWIAMGGTVDLATLDSLILQSCCRGPRSSISPIPSGRMEFLESGRARVNEKSRPIGKQKRRPGRGSQWGLHFPGRRSWCEPARFSARAALPRRTRPTKRNSRTLASSAPA